MKTNVWLCLPLLFVAGLFSGCSQGNIFSFAHSAGNTSNLNSLSIDANTALQSKDYAKALSDYTKLLKAQPSDANAIYGYAEAELDNSGLDVGALIANLLQQQNQKRSVLSLLFQVLGFWKPKELLPYSNPDYLIFLIGLQQL